MKNIVSKSIALALGVGSLLPTAAMATNGMNLEGYGPIAMGMGGASMAYDNGTAAVMNNPATLGLMEDGQNRIDGALGFLGPDITSAPPGGSAASSAADGFYMPAVGWAQRSGKTSYGVGMFAQGGMGTEYAANSYLAMGSGDKVMSQVGVMRIIAPLTYNVDSKLTIGGSLDFVRANMDLKMAVDTATLTSMVTGATPEWNATLGGLGGAGASWGRFDFDDGKDYSGAATGDGLGYKLGAVYKASSNLSIGASYHSETKIDDLKGNASLSAGNGGTVFGTFEGTIAIRNFQWPSTYGVGIAYLPSEQWLLVADYKRINWSDVMKDFRMSFTHAVNGTIDVAMAQNWKDQDVFQFGAAYKQDQYLTWRFGANIANNPVPNATVNPLFPAIIKEHYTGGVGYDLNKQQAVNFAVSYAPEVSVTNAYGTITHSQMSWQLMYSHGF